MADDPKNAKAAPKDADNATPNEGAAKAATKSKKPPPVEDKPFAEFIEQHYLPALEKAFTEQSVEDLALSFSDNQVTGCWREGQRQFTVYFPEGNIKKQRAFSWSTQGKDSGIIEPFLIDERKITLDLLVFGVIQRLNAQKWFGNN